jgi:hypothetical protein
MNVCHVVPSRDPSLGGPPVVASRLAAAQAALGHTVSILSYDTPAERVAIERSMRDIPGANRLRLIPPRLHAAVYRRSSRRRQLVRGIEDAIGPSTIVHLHGVWESIVRLAAKSALRLNILTLCRPARDARPVEPGAEVAQEEDRARAGLSDPCSTGRVPATC